jgi:hypothetical protein
MRKRTFFLYPEGRLKALTMSYDDGVVEDRRLIDIFNKHGIKGTFHLNSCLLGEGCHIKADEVAELYRGHEVACHGCMHASLDRISREEVVREMWDDRIALESLVGYPVRGASYANGRYSRDAVEILKSLGFVYDRTTISSGLFNLPDDFMTWSPTCHHSHDLSSKLEAFKKHKASLGLMYVWGHSYEFERNNNWGLIEVFCASASGDKTVWYASNIEIYDYLTAVRRMEYSADCRIVKNPSAIPVWLDVDGKKVKIESGELLRLY